MANRVAHLATHRKWGIGMRVNRREFIGSAVGALGAGVIEAATAEPGPPPIGMCDWSLGRMASVDAIGLAAEIGLDGVEVSLCTQATPEWLQRAEVRDRYLAAAGERGIRIPSIALGVLNEVPLKSEERAAQWVAESIPAAKALGARAVLLAFFGRGELSMEDAAGVDRVVSVLRDVAPAAREAGVVLGLENYLTAEENLMLLDRIGHESVQVYYDCKNAAHRRHDPVTEICQLGRGRLCQVHFKNGDLLLSQPRDVDFPACVQALKEIGYDGWIVLETSAPNDLIEDTRANVACVRDLWSA